jgi:hypothetical protein
VTVDGRVLRKQWDAAVDNAADVVRRQYKVAEQRGDESMARYLKESLGRMLMLRISVDARRTRPGGRATGLMYDSPIALAHEPYVAAGDAIAGIVELFNGGLGAPDWDWSGGFPPGWPTSLADRLRFTTALDLDHPAP